MSLDEYEERLLCCKHRESERVFGSVADSFEEELLEVDGFPEDYLNFIVRLLSDSRFYTKAGVWQFLLVMGTEYHRMTSKHYSRLRDTIIDHFNDYEDELLCLSVCDFIARNYSFADATAIFDRLEIIENQKSATLQGFVNDGRKIMFLEGARRKK